MIGQFTNASELKTRLGLMQLASYGVKAGKEVSDITLGFLHVLNDSRFDGTRRTLLWEYANAYLDGLLDGQAIFKPPEI